MRITIFLSILFLSVNVLSAQSKTEAVKEAAQEDVAEHDLGLQRLKSLMAGSFSSQNQSLQDTSYYNISLEMHQIWKERSSDTLWIFVEQALASKTKEPYRVRVYRVTALEDEQYESAVFELPKHERFVNKWSDTELFSTISPDSLLVREGCAVILEANGAEFIGSTVENECKSSLYGATYATSKVVVDYRKITSWDQGFDEDDQQVWGAENGPYIFEKRTMMSNRRKDVGNKPIKKYKKASGSN